MNHTKGPWSQGYTAQGKSAVWTDGRKEAQGNMGPSETWIDCNTEANARLISAAPELLEALIDLERTSGHGFMHDDPCRVKARAIIAKATGVA